MPFTATGGSREGHVSGSWSGSTGRAASRMELLSAELHPAMWSAGCSYPDVRRGPTAKRKLCVLSSECGCGWDLIFRENGPDRLGGGPPRLTLPLREKARDCGRPALFSVATAGHTHLRAGLPVRAIGRPGSPIHCPPRTTRETRWPARTPACRKNFPRHGGTSSAARQPDWRPWA